MTDLVTVDLYVDRISDVKWNDLAFEHLVIDPDSKDLVQALVGTKIASDKGTDIIVGKGNGLLVLLHGPPGTGKTLTAEGVAEFARKPLYRVTCGGDIGTTPEGVEQYLQSVLHLGKIWDCGSYPPIGVDPCRHKHTLTTTVFSRPPR